MLDAPRRSSVDATATTLTRDRLEDLWGCSILDCDGDRFGSLQEVFDDARTAEPEWLGVGVGLLGRRLVLVPARAAIATGFAIQVPFPAGFVTAAPELRHDDLDAHTVQALLDYYAPTPLGAS